MQHTLECISEQIKIIQDETFIEVGKSSKIIIPARELTQFKQQLENRKIEGDLDFEGTGLRFKCPNCNHENQVFNVIIIGEEINSVRIVIKQFLRQITMLE